MRWQENSVPFGERQTGLLERFAVTKGVLNRRFKRRFAYFAAEGKVGRAAARNLSFFAIYDVFAKGIPRPGAGHFLCAKKVTKDAPKPRFWNPFLSRGKRVGVYGT